MKITPLAAVVMSLIFCTIASAQTVTVRVNGVPLTSPAPQPNTPFPIPVTGPGVVLVEAFASPATTTDIGPLTLVLVGTVPSRVDVLIGQGAFPTEDFNQLASEARNWGGLTIDPASASDPLRDIVRVAGGIYGNLTGPITVSQVYRIQIGSSVAPVTTGNLLYPIMGTALFPLLDGEVVGRVFVTGSILANAPITAPNDPAGILSVQVGPTASTTAQVLSSIEAPGGAIDNIDVRGTIGTQANPVNIRAKRGIRSISAAGNINADVTANYDGGLGNLLNLRTTANGTFRGTINAYSLGIDDDPSAGADNTKGVNLSGDCVGEINIAFDAFWPINFQNMGTNSSITIARNLSASIVGSGTSSAATTIDIGGRVSWPDSAQNFQRFIRVGGPLTRLTIGGEVRPCHFGTLKVQATRVDELTIGTTPDDDAAGVFVTGGLTSAIPTGVPIPIGTVSMSGSYVGGRISATTIGSIQIGGDLGATIEMSQPLPPPVGTPPPPARIIVGGGFAGRLSIRSVQGLASQVIMNSKANPNAQWDGILAVRTATPTTDDEIFEEAPLYGAYATPANASRFVSNLPRTGVGAVGFAPFRLFDADCDPVNNEELPSPQIGRIPQSRFSQVLNPGTGNELPQLPVHVRFFGPVYAESSSLPPIQVWRLIDDYRFKDVTNLVTIDVRQTPGAPYSRELNVRGNGTVRFPRGTYLILDRQEVGRRLLCTGLDASVTDPVPVPEFYYFFGLDPDCNWDGTADASCSGCAADVDDGNGLGYPDGGVTIDDLLFYLDVYERGLAFADLDDGSGTGSPDGGVTIDDLLYFLDRYAAGC